jgi:hypothetical protein
MVEKLFSLMSSWYEKKMTLSLLQKPAPGFPLATKRRYRRYREEAEVPVDYWS